MKCIRLEDAGVDICVTIQVKPIFMEKPSGELKEELERLETARVLKHIGATHEETIARHIAKEYRNRQDRHSDS